MFYNTTEDWIINYHTHSLTGGHCHCAGDDGLPVVWNTDRLYCSTVLVSSSCVTVMRVMCNLDSLDDWQQFVSHNDYWRPASDNHISVLVNLLTFSYKIHFISKLCTAAFISDRWRRGFVCCVWSIQSHTTVFEFVCAYWWDISAHMYLS